MWSTILSWKSSVPAPLRMDFIERRLQSKLVAEAFATVPLNATTENLGCSMVLLYAKQKPAG